MPTLQSRTHQKILWSHTGLNTGQY